MFWPTLSEEGKELIKEPRCCNYSRPRVERVSVKIKRSGSTSGIGTCLKNIDI